jgi:hypothetical protein
MKRMHCMRVARRYSSARLSAAAAPAAAASRADPHLYADGEQVEHEGLHRADQHEEHGAEDQARLGQRVRQAEQPGADDRLAQRHDGDGHPAVRHAAGAVGAPAAHVGRAQDPGDARAVSGRRKRQVDARLGLDKLRVHAPAALAAAAARAAPRPSQEDFRRQRSFIYYLSKLAQGQWTNKELAQKFCDDGGREARRPRGGMLQPPAVAAHSANSR